MEKQEDWLDDLRDTNPTGNNAAKKWRRRWNWQAWAFRVLFGSSLLIVVGGLIWGCYWGGHPISTTVFTKEGQIKDLKTDKHGYYYLTVVFTNKEIKVYDRISPHELMLIETDDTVATCEISYVTLTYHETMKHKDGTWAFADEKKSILYLPKDFEIGHK